MSGRISFTKLQRSSGAAVALIDLVGNITADGRIERAEVDLLRQWIEENRELGWKQFGFLEATITKALADGVLTSEEELEIYLAVEAVLPPADRACVVQRRKVADAARKEARKRELWEEAEKARAEAAKEQFERNKLLPAFPLDFMVAGTRYEARPAAIFAFARPYDRAYLIRDRENPKSRHAIAVRTWNGAHIGYVPDWLATEFSHLLDAGYRHKTTFGQIYEGGKYGITVSVGGGVYRPDTTVPDTVTEAEVPEYGASSPRPVPAFAERAENPPHPEPSLLRGVAWMAAIALTVAILANSC